MSSVLTTGDGPSADGPSLEVAKPPNAVASIGRRPGRLPALDGLRGLAVAAVVAFHYWPDVVPGGYIGVSVFFTLSGYLIATLVRDEKARTGRVALTGFWLRRVRRLLPAATIVLAVVLAVVAVTESDELRRVAGDVLAATFYVANWRTAAEPGGYEALFDTAVRPVGHFWSLSIEEQFYLLGPFVLALRARWLLGILAAITFGGVFWWWGAPDSYYATPVRAGEIAAGVVLAVVVSRARLPSRVGPVVGPPALLALIVIALSWTETEPALYRGGLLLVATMSVLAVIGALGDDAWTRFLSVGLFVWLGRRSYAVYLFHWPVLELTPWSPAVCLVVSLVLAEVSWRLVEQPILAGRGWDRAIGAVVGAALILVAVAAVVLWVGEGPEPTAAELLGEARTLDGSSPTVGSIDAAPRPESAAPEPVPLESPTILIVGDSQALAVGEGFASWAQESGTYRVIVVGIEGCSGLVAEGWGLRFDAGESGEIWPGNFDGCALPALDQLLEAHQPAAVLVAEWGTATLDHRSPATGEWRSTTDIDVQAAWRDRYATMTSIAADAGVPTGFITGPPCGREAPCSAPGRIEAYHSALEATGGPVLDVGKAFATDPDRYRTQDGAHVEEGRAAFLLGAEVIAPFVAALLAA